MFDWIRTKFASNGGLALARTRAANAAMKYGNANSRKAARNTAEALEAKAGTTKLALETLQKVLKEKEDMCRRDIATAKENIATAQKAHNEVKDTTFQKIGRLITVGKAGWASRTAAVNAAQARQKSVAEAKAKNMVEIATKRKALLEEEAKKRAEEEKLINDVLKGSQQAAASAESVIVPTAAPVNNKVKNAQNAAANARPAAKAAGMEALMGGRRRGGRRGRTHKRR